MALSLTFSLHISADDYLRYYKGQVQDVQVHTDDGRRLQFPAAALRPFLTHEGIRGRFRINFDANHKLQGLEKL